MVSEYIKLSGQVPRAKHPETVVTSEAGKGIRYPGYEGMLK